MSVAAEEDDWNNDDALVVTAVYIAGGTEVFAALEKATVDDDAEPGDGISLALALELDRLRKASVLSSVEKVKDLTSFFSIDDRRSMSRLILAFKTTSAPTAQPNETIIIANTLSLKFDSFCFQGTFAAGGYLVLPRIEVSSIEHAAEMLQLSSNSLRSSFVMHDELKNERTHPIFNPVRV
jgi:hypothetical protein